MHSAFLHKVDDLVLHQSVVVLIVVQLYLHFVLQLSILLKELLVLRWVSKILVVLGKQVNFAIVSP